MLSALNCSVKQRTVVQAESRGYLYTMQRRSQPKPRIRLPMAILGKLSSFGLAFRHLYWHSPPLNPPLRKGDYKSWCWYRLLNVIFWGGCYCTFYVTHPPKSSLTGGRTCAILSKLREHQSHFPLPYIIYDKKNTAALWVAVFWFVFLLFAFAIKISNDSNN